MQEDDVISPLEVGMMLQLAIDIVDAYDEVIEKQEKINDKTLKLVKLQDSFFDKSNSAEIDNWISKNKEDIKKLKKQRKSIYELKKGYERIINKHIDEVVDIEDNLKYKAFLYDWKLK